MSSPIHVTHLIVRLDTGGAEKSLYRLIRQRRETLVHHVICLGPPSPIGDDISALGTKVSYFDLSKAGPMALWRAWRELKAAPPDILQGWMYLGNLFACVLALALPKQMKVAWNVRSSPDDFRREKRRIRWVVKLSTWFTTDLIIYNSFAGEQSHAHLGFSTGLQKVIPNGIDLQEFGVVLHRDRAVAASFLSDHLGRDVPIEPTIPWVGMLTRYHPVKGIAPFLEAAARLKAQGARVRFLLAGPGMQADNDLLANQIQQSKLTNQVDLVGPITDSAQFMATLDMLVVASLREGTPNVLLEAMACGVYTVATNVGDIARILTDPARIAPPGDVGALAGVIKSGLEVCQAEGQTAGPSDRVIRERQLLAEQYDSQACVAAYSETYECLFTSNDPLQNRNKNAEENSEVNK